MLVIAAFSSSGLALLPELLASAFPSPPFPLLSFIVACLVGSPDVPAWTFRGAFQGLQEMKGELKAMGQWDLDCDGDNNRLVV
jgi:hypothetical protein